MILIWEPGATKPTQYRGLDNPHLSTLVEKGYKVFIFDSAEWTFKFWEDGGWKYVDFIDTHTLPF